MTQIQLLTDQTFRDRVTLQSITLARVGVANVNTSVTEKDYFKEVLRNPNDGHRIQTYVTLIASQVDVAAYDAVVAGNNESNINAFIRTEIIKVYKEAAKIWS